MMPIPETDELVKEQLWQRLAAFELDDSEAALPFSRRLARDNGWSQVEALAAIEEYRRFVFLAMVAGHPVTPSDEVDQVWHLHLSYTRSYWEELCGEVLGRALHHGPTRGGAREGKKFEDWYGKTLLSYEQHFGEMPSRQWWPEPRVRMAARHWRRVDVSDRWLLSRGLVKRQLAVAAAVVAVLGFAGCNSASGGGSYARDAALALVGLGVFLWFIRKIGGGGGGGACGGGFIGGGDSGGGDSGGGGSGCGGSGCGGGGCGGGG